jgi:2-oxoglutarate dehydrogenase dihydrolipoamide succinyltransferase (E2 component)
VSSSPTEQVANGGAKAAGLIEVSMPQMGISVSEGTILEWRKRPGDWIEADETIADVTTDKVDVEIPAPASGRLERIVVEPGDTVAVGTVLAEIDAGAKPGEAHPEEGSSPAAAGPVSDEGTSPDFRPVSSASGGAPSSAPPAEETSGTDRSRFYSPVVRRIADKHSVDLDQVEGTGIGGRVRKRDVLAFIENGGGGDEAPAQKTLHIESPYRPEEAETTPAETGATAPAPVTGGHREPMSPMRQAIARHMVESRRTSAHVTTIVEVDFSRVAAARARLKESMKRRGVSLTYLAFVATATVEALREFPELNSSVEGDELVFHDDVNLGIAVALDDGLIVPVIPKAQRLSLEGMAAAIGDVATRARAKQLEPDEVHGGTFTITNPGQFGAVIATPIINQPQVAILDLEAIVKRPVVVEGPEGDSIAIRPMAFLPLSFDHRALDGAAAARFLARVKERLESWEAGS